MEKRAVLRKEVKSTAGMCGFLIAHLCFASSAGHAAQQVPLWSQQFLYSFICVCFRGVQVDERLFLMPCLKTYRICVAEICKGLTLLQNLTFKDLKR